MTQREQKKAAKSFAEFWKDKGDERQHTQKFWNALLRDVLGVFAPDKTIDFERRVKIGGVKFIDAYLADTRVAIEQKGLRISLDRAKRQSDGTELTPYEQAKRYNDNLPFSERCRWIVVCNFAEFRIYDMDSAEPDKHFETVLLKDLERDFCRLLFLVDEKSESIRRKEEISLKAGELVGKLYDALYKEYINPDEKSLRALNILCVRIVFCLYAEDAGLFATKTAFEDYIKSFSLPNLRGGIISLFRALDTKEKDRDKYDTKLQPFPYVNGGLFSDERIEIPNFTQEIVDVIVNHCAPFNWSEISPTIFGAVFESTLNPDTRRTGGMHYTSIQNIHRVIDPLFMDDLNTEFERICTIKTDSQRNKKLTAFQKRLGSLTFLDPACGSGNFLTETYLSLRRLENKVISHLYGEQITMGEFEKPIRIEISQFYGIEINDFAVTVAKTALWIAESQMVAETENIVSQTIDFLPLTNHANIIEGNALRLDWATLAEEEQAGFMLADKLNVYKIDEHFGALSVRDSGAGQNDTSLYGRRFKELNVIAREVEEKALPEPKGRQLVTYSYIIGNPPFVGARYMDRRQKEDVLLTFGKDWQGVGDMDYVCCWYRKALAAIKGADTRCAFVSTNSVSQGGSVANLWKPLFDDGLHIDFAWRTFRWANETTDKKNMAAVHCVIIGFSVAESGKQKVIFHSDGQRTEAKNINGYLLDMPNVFVESRKKPICDVPEIGIGNKPIDGGNYLFTDEHKRAFIKKEPAAEQYFHKWLGSDEFINGYNRWCLWLGDLRPAELFRLPECMKRVQAVRDFRLASKSAPTVRLAEKPTRFHVENFPKGNYLLIPRVSSENRTYIPIGFISPDVIASDATHIIPDATLYHFGVLTSNVHNAWMRTVCGRLESRYRYSANIVYNNFPWCSPTDAQKVKIEQTAQAILDAREAYADCTLAQLYGDKSYMVPELGKAHEANDRAVMAAYGLAPKMAEAEIVAELFRMYEEIAGQKAE